mgnify:CR=1 FL=1
MDSSNNIGVHSAPSKNTSSYEAEPLAELPRYIEQERILALFINGYSEEKLIQFLKSKGYTIENCTFLFPEKTLKQITEQIARYHEDEYLEIKQIAQQYRDNLGFVQKEYELKDPFLRMAVTICKRTNKYLLFTNEQFLEGLENGDVNIFKELVNVSTCKVLIFLSNPTSYTKYKQEYTEFRFMGIEDLKAEPLVYVSHPWDSEAEKFTDGLCVALRDSKIPYEIDKKDLEIGMRISEFEKRIGNGRIVMPIIDEKYLRSVECMYELAETADHKDFSDRVLPIVIFDINRDYETLEKLQDYWRKKYQEYSGHADKLGAVTASDGCLEDMRRVGLILKQLGKIWDYLKGNLTYSKDDITREGYRGIIEAIKKRLVVKDTVYQNNAIDHLDDIPNPSTTMNFQFGQHSTIINNESGTININNK